ncbi:MAG: tRNA lysidine(34) synthetase TilS, partial [Dehalococcoidia bacterium]
MNESASETKAIGSVRAHALISSGERVVVGVSGGADSVCLLHILSRWQKELGIGLHVAHLDHQLRGAEAEADAQYVSRLAESLGLPVTVDRQDVAAHREAARCSIEEAARELRYGFFARVARHTGATRIAVGHTRDDQVETILMHILRGTGIDGLCGLARSSPIGGIRQPMASQAAVPGGLRVIRPLLDVSRSETTDYCQEWDLRPRIDSSNLAPLFFRNRLRLHLLPVLRQYNPDIDQALLRLADLAREDSAFMRERVSALWDAVARSEGSAVHLDKKQAAGLPAALQRRLLRAAVAALAGDTMDIEASHIE